jgi:hypothetical protein
MEEEKSVLYLCIILIYLNVGRNAFYFIFIFVGSARIIYLCKYSFSFRLRDQNYAFSEASVSGLTDTNRSTCSSSSYNWPSEKLGKNQIQ